MKNVRNIVLASLFIALTYIATAFFSIKYAPGGYFHFGDVFILLASSFLPLFPGVLVALIAPTFADLTAGFPLFIVYTIFAKLFLILGGYLFNRSKTGYFKYLYLLVGAVFSLLVYFVAYINIYGISSLAVTIPFDIIQVVSSTIMFIILRPIIHKILKRIVNKKSQVKKD